MHSDAGFACHRFYYLLFLLYSLSLFCAIYPNIWGKTEKMVQSGETEPAGVTRRRTEWDGFSFCLGE